MCGYSTLWNIWHFFDIQWSVAESFASACILRCSETSLSLSVSSQLFLLCLVIISCIEFVYVSWLNVTWDDQADSSLCFLQCFDTVSWMTGTASSQWKPVPLVPKSSFLEWAKEENWDRTSKSRFTWQMAVNTEVLVVVVECAALFFYSTPQCESAVLATAIPSACPSVCLSVCPSHAGIVSKWWHVARWSLHCWIAKCV